MSNNVESVSPVDVGGEECAGVLLVNVCHLLDSLFGECWPEYEAECAAVKSWCVAHEASYYAAPREDFYEGEAAELALREGHRVVVLEDLS